MNRRDRNEPLIIAAFQAHGCSVVPLHTPCDLAVGYRGASHLVEVKAGGGKLTPAQVKFRDAWRGDFAVVRSVDDVVEMVMEWQRSGG